MTPDDSNRQDGAGAFKQIEREPGSLAATVYSRVVDALLEGRIGPGDRLIMDRLAEGLDVSRTPVRDALLRLREEGIVEPSGRRGYIVATLGSDEIRQLYEARYAIEGYAAAEIAASGGERLERVRKALADSAEVPMTTARESFVANRDFHRAVVAAIDNPHLLAFFDTIWGRALAGWAYHEFFSARPYDGFLEDHSALVEEIAAGDADRARAAMVKHIEAGLEATTAGGPSSDGSEQ